MVNMCSIRIRHQCEGYAYTENSHLCTTYGDSIVYNVLFKWRSYVYLYANNISYNKDGNIHENMNTTRKLNCKCRENFTFLLNRW